MKVILVDTFGFFFRSYYALPPLHNSKHFPTSLLTGFATLIFNLYKENPHSCIIFALEGQGDNKRKEFYPDYKANRKETPKDLLLQLPVAIQWLKKMNIPTLCIDGYEADDCIATLATLGKNKGFEVEIISHDKDLYQLIDEKIHIFDYAKRQVISHEECKEKFGVLPNEFITYQSIVGDTSDNIPGIKGIGAKGAQKIVSSFKTLESLYETLQLDKDKVIDLLGKRQTNLILEHKDEAFLSRELVTLRRDLLQDFEFMTNQYDTNQTPLSHIVEELQEYELQKILQKINSKLDNIPSTHQNSFHQDSIIQNITPKRHKDTRNTFSLDVKTDTHLITDEKLLFEILESIPPRTIIAFDCETNGLDVRVANMVGFSFCFDGKNGYYVPILHDNKEQTLLDCAILDSTHEDRQSHSLFDNITQDNNAKKPTLETNSKPMQNDTASHKQQISYSSAKKALEIIFSYPMIGHNIKFDLHIAWHNFRIKPQQEIKDSMILAWLHDTNQSLKLDSLVLKHFNYKMIAFNEVVPKGKDFSDIDLKTASEYAAEDAIATYKLYFLLENLLDSHLREVAYTLEFPFITTLCHLEDSGIKINPGYFTSLKKEMQQKLMNLQQQIHAISGYEFNVNSTKQLAEVLFDKLQLDTQKKGKTGYSTDEATLIALKDSHPVIPLLLEYREIFKLFSTYVEPLLKLKGKDLRIYTSFVQTGTNTGRLSSKNPNLQNIPVRSELGKSIRKGFEAQDGNVLLSLDYSQIELRLLAHFSKDSVLLEAFARGADIHAETAKRIFNLKENKSISLFDIQPDLTQDKDFTTKRSIAKSINFGLIYGMGARKLAQTLQIPQNEAKTYIENYFANFPSVKQYLESKKDEILRNGYSQTLLGRKRHFDFFRATEFMQSNYLREGVNTIFQGSAADLIKLSMNKIYKEIKAMQDQNLAKMLLQVHDELIFEVKETLASEIGVQIQTIMQDIYPLSVPLICNICFGKTWADLK